MKDPKNDLTTVRVGDRVRIKSLSDVAVSGPAAEYRYRYYTPTTGTACTDWDPVRGYVSIRTQNGTMRVVPQDEIEVERRKVPLLGVPDERPMMTPTEIVLMAATVSQIDAKANECDIQAKEFSRQAMTLIRTGRTTDAQRFLGQVSTAEKQAAAWREAAIMLDDMMASIVRGREVGGLNGPPLTYASNANGSNLYVTTSATT